MKRNRIGLRLGAVLALGKSLLAMSYGATQSEIYMIAAEQVAKILDGARPSELPRQATRFELVINKRTAEVRPLRTFHAEQEHQRPEVRVVGVGHAARTRR